MLFWPDWHLIVKMVSSIDIDDSHQRTLGLGPAAIISVVLVAYLCWNRFQPGLVKIPGPTLAAYTKLWRLHSVWQGSAHLDAIALHRKHGNLVRIAPTHVSVADPKWIPTFYGTRENYTKVNERYFSNTCDNEC